MKHKKKIMTLHLQPHGKCFPLLGFCLLNHSKYCANFHDTSFYPLLFVQSPVFKNGVKIT